MSMLDDEVVLVTGAARGIGAAIAEHAAAQGAHLVLSDLDPEGAAVAEELERRGARAAFLAADVRDRGQVDALVQLAIDVHARAPSVVFANAGVEGPLGNGWELPEGDFRRVIDTNLFGVWHTAAAVLPHMIERGAGSIVATASVAGLVGSAGLAFYVASKHAVVGLVKALALETASSGVRVNAICPGVIETSMVDRLEAQAPEFRDALLRMKPMGRMGSPREVARAAVWLASPDASFTTGHTLTVDGGFVTQ